MPARCDSLRQNFTHSEFLKSEAGCIRALEASSCCLQLPWDRIVVANTPTSSNAVAVYSRVDESWQEGQDLLCVITRNWPADRDSCKCCPAHWQVRVYRAVVADAVCLSRTLLQCEELQQQERAIPQAG